MPRRDFDQDCGRRIVEFEREGRSFDSFANPSLQFEMSVSESVLDDYIVAGDLDDAMRAVASWDGPTLWLPAPPQKGSHWYLRCLSETFEKKGELQKIKALWRRTITLRKPFFWSMFREIAATPSRKERRIAELRKATAEFKECLLAAMNDYREALERIGDETELAKLRAAIEEVESEQRRKIEVQPDPRKMDEEVFWSLIAKSRKGADGFSEQVEQLTALLAAFKPTEIARFQRILHKRLRESCRQDLWAVAYIIGGGCSDDGFEYFRGALIASGRKRFEAAIANPEKAATGLDSGSDFSCEEILYAAREAYLSVQGEDLFEIVSPIEPAPKGRQWEQSELPTMFPRLWGRLKTTSRFVVS